MSIIPDHAPELTPTMPTSSTVTTSTKITAKITATIALQRLDASRLPKA